MNKIEIIRAVPEDMPYINEKIKNYLLDGANATYEQFFVGRENNKVVVFGRLFDRGDYFEPGTLGVDYYHRGQGLGVAMVEYLLAEARRRDPAKPIYTITHRFGFVEKCGFKEVKEYPEELEEKRKKCHLDCSKIKVFKYAG